MSFCMPFSYFYIFIDIKKNTKCFSDGLVFYDHKIHRTTMGRWRGESAGETPSMELRWFIPALHHAVWACEWLCIFIWFIVNIYKWTENEKWCLHETLDWVSLTWTVMYEPLSSLSGLLGEWEWRCEEWLSHVMSSHGSKPLVSTALHLPWSWTWRPMALH